MKIDSASLLQQKLETSSQYESFPLQSIQIHVKESFREFGEVKPWKEIKGYSVSLAWKSFVGVAGRKANLEI